MSRNLSHVSEVWKEYTKGLAGSPAVEQLEKTNKKWRTDPTEGKFFRRRKVIYDEIKRIAATGNIPMEDAVRALEEKRKALKNTSIDSLIKNLQDEKVARKALQNQPPATGPAPAPATEPAPAPATGPAPAPAPATG
jgi:hypothetical protein